MLSSRGTTAPWYEGFSPQSASINRLSGSRRCRQGGRRPVDSRVHRVVLDATHRLTAAAATFGIGQGVERTGDRQACFRFRVPDEVDDGHTVEPRPAPPILGNEAEHAMLDLIPLAGARRKVRDMDREVEGIGQPLQLGFPQAYATAVTAAAIRRDIEVRGLFV